MIIIFLYHRQIYGYWLSQFKYIIAIRISQCTDRSITYKLSHLLIVVENRVLRVKKEKSDEGRVACAHTDSLYGY